MAWQFPITSTSNATTIDLLTTDSVWVLDGVVVTSNGGTVISGSGSAQLAIIDGTIGGSGGISLGGSATTDSGLIVEVSSTGKIISTDDHAVSIYGHDSKFTNDGYIYSRYSQGLYLDAEATTGQSTITNNGSIIAGTFGIAGSASTQERDIVNNGTIKVSSATNYAIYGGAGVDHVVNNGNMSGQVSLNGGADFFDTRNGTVNGDIHGGEGADTIYGSKAADTIYGDAGIDKIIGGGGADGIYGGTEADQFVYVGVSDSTMSARDTIHDFAHEDVIDIHNIDANSKVAGNQAFAFIGTSAFSHTADELRYAKVSGDTYIYGDTNGDGKADFSVKLDGSITMVSHDFIL